VGWTQWVTTLVELLVSKDAVHAPDYILLNVLQSKAQYVTDLYFIAKYRIQSIEYKTVVQLELCLFQINLKKLLSGFTNQIEI
jgi:hypothetical protein